LALPLFLAELRERFANRASYYRYLAITSLTLLGSLFLIRFNPRRLGIANPLPDGYTPPAFSPLRLPEFPFWSISPEPFWNLVFFLAVLALAGGTLAAWRHYDKRVRETDIVLALLLVSAVFHMFVVSAGLILLLLLRYQLHRVSEHPLRSYVLFSLAVVAALFWITYALLSYDSVTSLIDGERSPVKVLARAFFGWPDFYGPVLMPWLKEMPLLGLIVASALAYQIISRAREPLAAVVRHPAFIVAYFALCLGIFNSLYTSTRYFFFVYPFILLVVGLTAAEIVERFTRRVAYYERTSTQALAMLGCLAIFVLTEDFHFRHITDISSEQVRFRLGEFKRFSPTWYARSDFESPAVFARSFADGEPSSRVIVDGLPPVSYYLGRPHAVYYERSGRRFYNVSRASGTVDLWSNQRLLSTDEELRSYTRCADQVVFIRSSQDRNELDFAKIWPVRLASAAPAFTSIDGRIEAVVVKLRPNDAVCRNSNKDA
jgi:hypothetical protein